MDLTDETLQPAAIDPELRPALDAFAANLPEPGAPMTAESLPGVRAMLASLPRPSDEQLGREGRFLVEHAVAPGLDGAPDVPLLVLRPRGADATGCLVWLHGGGMIFGSRYDGIDEMADYADAMSMVLVSVEYRLAPETPYPGPVDDGIAALRWVAENADALGVPIDAVVLAGGSAGGGLAAMAAARLRAEEAPALRGLMLLAPMLDDRNTSDSVRQLPPATIWSREANGFGWRSLLGSDAAAGSPAPARIADLSGMPQGYIDVGGADGFRDEDAAFALGLSRDGVLVEFHLWAGGYHGFEGMAPAAAVSAAARSARADWLRRLLSAS